MKPFNKPGGYSKSGGYEKRGGGGYEKRGGFGRPKTSSWEKEMFDSQCAECGDRCQVPFKPNGRKPVLCSNCFRPERSQEGGARSFDRRERSDRPERSERPAYRSTPRPENSDVVKQLRALNEKVDRILEALTDLGEEEDLEDEDLEDLDDMEDTEDTSNDEMTFKE